MIQLVRPHRGPITQWYGNIQPDGMPHAGQDYGYTDGENIYPEVYAAAAGVVLFAGDSRTLGWPNDFYVNPDFDRSDAQDSSAGNLIVLRHWDGSISFVTGYAHLESFRVKAGDSVKAGQLIGITGNTGYSFGKHLHFFLMFQPYNYATSTYGCADPNPYLGGLTAQGAIEEDTLSAAEKDEIIRAVQADGKKTREYIKALAYSGWSDEKGKKHPGFMLVIEEEQRRAADDRANLPKRIAAAVWGTVVKRSSGPINVLQDLVNGATAAMKAEPAVAEILEDVREDDKIEAAAVMSADPAPVADLEKEA